MVFRHRYKVSFLLTSAIYLLLFFIFLEAIKPLESAKRSNKGERVSLSLKNLEISRAAPQSKKSLPSKKEPPKKISKPVKKRAQKPKPKQQQKSQKPKKVAKKPEKTVKKIADNTAKKPKPIKKTPKKTVKKAVAKESNQTAKQVPSLASLAPKQKSAPALESFFKSSPAQAQKTQKDKEINKLYGKEFESFTKGQKEFIKDNLQTIGKITQKYLYIRGYPEFAVKTKQEGVNVVEFLLHPNGDISDLKIIKGSGYTLLDENSLETIKTAYKDYPRPTETTKIRIYVEYRIIY